MTTVVPNPATWGRPDDWRAQWEIPVGPPDHTLRVTPPARDTDGIAVEIDMPGKKGIAGWCYLGPEEARAAARRLNRYADEATPASELGLGAITMMLDAINDARGTSYTVESVAASLGMEQPLSVAEASDIAKHIGGVLLP
jgi:hypothetical protein